jgi:hypothetical protein
MNFDGAIQAHTDWKLRLLSYCRGKTTEKIDLQTLRKDNVCVLGQWLYGEGRRYGAEPGFEELREIHAAFHQSAATIAAMVDHGQAPAAAALLSSRESEFTRLSIRIVGLLMDLQRRHPA